MVGNCKRLGTLQGVLYMLCTIPVAYTFNQLNEDREKILNQSINKATSMEPKITELFQLYVSQQELQPYISFCNESLNWFPKNIPSLPEREMLQEIYKTLTTMCLALARIIRQQKAGHPNNILIDRLNSIERSTAALQSNSVLLLQKDVPAYTPTDPPNPNGHFDQKVEGCRVLYNYMKFIQEVQQGLRRITKQRCRRHGKKRRTEKVYATRSLLL